MADPGFPGQHTTTTVLRSETTIRPDIRFDPTYIRTLPGILKAVQVVLNLIGFICIEASGAFAYHSRGSWFNFVAMTAFWFTGILLFFYLFHIIERLHMIPWLKIEMIFCAVWTLLYLIAACLAVTFASEAFAAAGFFGFCAMVAYGFDAYLKYRGVQNGEIAQGERVISQTTVSSPA